MKERQKNGPTLGIIQEGGQNSRSQNALSSEQLESCAEFNEANMLFARKKAWDQHNHIFKVPKGLMFMPDLPTQQLKRKLSHLGQIANMKSNSLLWTVAHLFTC